ncbi:hypothetical protein SOPP22_04715 [Shewanella sp. OPT22]|nr:hypothetical protein SOPP22_04715 [Shewanella sp. OPT22]
MPKFSGYKDKCVYHAADGVIYSWIKWESFEHVNAADKTQYVQMLYKKFEKQFPHPYKLTVRYFSKPELKP